MTPAPAWVGSSMPAVRADQFGTYVFVLARVVPCVVTGLSASHRQQQKLVLRGKAGLSEGRLMDALNQEVVQAMAAHSLPRVALSLLGSGTLSWGRGQDLGVRILPGDLSLLPLASKCYVGSQAVGMAAVLAAASITSKLWTELLPSSSNARRGMRGRLMDLNQSCAGCKLGVPRSLWVTAKDPLRACCVALCPLARRQEGA